MVWFSLVKAIDFLVIANPAYNKQVWTVQSSSLYPSFTVLDYEKTSFWKYSTLKTLFKLFINKLMFLQFFKWTFLKNFFETHTFFCMNSFLTHIFKQAYFKVLIKFQNFQIFQFDLIFKNKLNWLTLWHDKTPLLWHWGISRFISLSWKKRSWPPDTLVVRERRNIKEASIFY